MRFKISYPLLIALVLIFVYAKTLDILVFLLACAIHEMGHVFALKLQKARIECLHATICGLNIIYSNAGRMSYAFDAAAALAGPAANVAMGLLCVLISKIFNAQWLYYFIGLNLSLAIFNLLPLKALDGGRALHSVISGVSSEDKADIILGKISLITSVLMLVLGIVTVLLGGNVSLIIVSVVLIIGNFENKALHMGRKKLLYH